jgi:hypothetical protein
MVNISVLHETYLYHQDVLYKVSSARTSIGINGTTYQLASRSYKDFHGQRQLELEHRLYPVKDIIWMLHHGEIDDSQTVKYVDASVGNVLSNLYLDHKEERSVLSEHTSTGLTGIYYDAANGVYYYARMKKRILDSVNSDWRVTLNYRLKLLQSKWLRPAVPYANTPSDVWEYVSRVEAGYHKGTIEDLPNIPAKPRKSTLPRVAYFYTN